MRTLLLSYMLSFFILALIGCDTGNNVDSSNVNPPITAQISWTQDVTEINMTEVGVVTSEISQNSIFELKPGRGDIYWVSSGVEYSRSIDVGNVEENSEDGIECEQEGEHEGENEGCLFSFSFSGDMLTISM